MRVKEALDELAPERAQHPRLFRQLDTLGDDRQIKITAQRQQCPQEPRGLRIAVDVGDECDIDLDRPKIIRPK